MLSETKQLGTTMTLLSEEELERTGRLKVCYVSRQGLVSLLRQGEDGRFIRVKGMPEDAVIVGLSDHSRFSYNQIALKVFSQTFEVVTEGCTIPEFTLECSVYQEAPYRGREFI